MDAYAEWDQSLFTEERAAPRYLGVDPIEAERRAIEEGISRIRVVDLDATPEMRLTLDLCVDRLNLLVHDGKVVRAGFF
jgi:hypothetical protein